MRSDCVSYPDGGECGQTDGAPIVIETSDAGLRWSNENLPGDIKELDGTSCPAPSVCDIVGYTASNVVVLRNTRIDGR